MIIDLKTLAIASAVATTLAMPATARAQRFIDVTIGVAGGGLATATGHTYGGQLTFFGARFGVEGDYSFSAKLGPASSSPPGVQVNNLYIRTLMGNVLFGPHIGGEKWRPYAAFGVGLIGAVGHTSDVFQLGSHDGQNDIGINVGGGVIGWLTKRIGIRVDVRYLKDLRASHELPGVKTYFIRAGGGLALRF